MPGRATRQRDFRDFFIFRTRAAKTHAGQARRHGRDRMPKRPLGPDAAQMAQRGVARFRGWHGAGPGQTTPAPRPMIPPLQPLRWT